MNVADTSTILVLTSVSVHVQSTKTFWKIWSTSWSRKKFGSWVHDKFNQTWNVTKFVPSQAENVDYFYSDREDCVDYRRRDVSKNIISFVVSSSQVTLVSILSSQMWRLQTSWDLTKLRHPIVRKLWTTNLLFFPLVCFVLVLSALLESPLIVLSSSLLSTPNRWWSWPYEEKSKLYDRLATATPSCLRNFKTQIRDNKVQDKF